jgi:hypothetical protein
MADCKKNFLAGAASHGMLAAVTTMLDAIKLSMDARAAELASGAPLNVTCFDALECGAPYIAHELGCVR